MRTPLKIENVWHLGETSNFVEGVDPHTGQLIGRHDVTIGETRNVCPAIDGAISWNHGTYSPDTGLYYKVGQEWCQNMEAQTSAQAEGLFRQDVHERHL